MLTYNAPFPSIGVTRPAGFDWLSLPKAAVIEPTAVKRGLVVSPEVARVLDGSSAPPDLAVTDAQRVARRFMTGEWISVARGYTKARAMVKQMADVDELWTICLREQAPGYRIIGRFMERDFFVGLLAPHRSKLKASFQPAIDLWNERLGSASFVRSDKLEDYLSNEEMYDEI